MRATVMMVGMSVIHMLVSPTGLDPLQRSLSQTEQCSEACPTTEQGLIAPPDFEHERVTCLIPLTRLRNYINENGVC